MARTGIGKGNHANSRKNLKPIQPGQSGNPKGRPPGIKYISEALREQLGHKRVKVKTPADKLARNLIQRAEESDSAINIVLERTEGKVTQPVQAQIDTDVTWVIGKGYEASEDKTSTDKQDSE